MNANVKFLILALPRPIKRLIVMTSDAGTAIFSVWLAYYLRTGLILSFWPPQNGYFPLLACVAAVVICIPVFMATGLYRAIFRYSDVPAMLTVGKAIAVYGVIYITVFTIFQIDGVPRTVGVIQPMIMLLLIACTRFAARFWLGGMYEAQLRQEKRPNALIYGAGVAGRDLAAALIHSDDVNVVGFIDGDVRLQGNHIKGLLIYDPINIESLAKRKNITEVMLALPSVGRRRRHEIINTLQGQGYNVRTLPSYSNLLKGQVTVSDVRELSVDDILGRDSVDPNQELMTRDITGKIVLVTGAGGSIGSELCRQIFYQLPKKILLLDHSEFALHTIYEELQSKVSQLDGSLVIIPILASVRDNNLLDQVFTDFSPDTVFHAAAYKHVPLVENNKLTGIGNNVFGTFDIATAAISAGVKKFVLISTDKAVRPTNVMGASKRLAEMTLQGLSMTQSKTIFAIVRFGNVLDSSGSVVPLFRQQIKSGGPVTVRHVDVTRYFMTISEAAQLVIQAGAMTMSLPKKGRAAPVYLLDMGSPVKIIDLARKMIELSGLAVYEDTTCEGDIEIKIVGLRPGEKLYEELLIGDSVRDSMHPKIKFSEEEFMPWPRMQKDLSDLLNSVQENNQSNSLMILDKLVNDLSPTNMLRL